MDKRPPLVPITFCDVPSQRLYVVSSIALLQAYKLFQLLDYIWSGLASEGRSLWIYWSFLDASIIGILVPLLRIPRLQLGVLQRILIVAILVATNWLLAGNWHLSLSALLALLPRPIKEWFDYQTAILEYKVRLQDVINPSSHILGKHTIHILPYSTAKLNPSAHCFCLSSTLASASISIPIIFNNSIPHLLQYSVTNFTTGEKSLYNLTQAQLRPLSKQKKSQKSLEDWLEDEESDLNIAPANSYAHNQQSLSRPQTNPDGSLKIGRTQHLYNIDVRQVGVIRLERVLDEENMDIRIARTEALVVECPRAGFASDGSATSSKSLLPWSASAGQRENHKCLGQTEDFGLVVEGLAPLSLTYQQIVNGHRKSIRLDGLTPSDFVTPLISLDISSLSEKLTISHRSDYNWAEKRVIDIPLNVSLATAGEHIYQLDNIKDACGHGFDFIKARDIGSVKKTSSDMTKLIDQRRVTVHDKSQVSFLGCGNSEDEPMRLLKGKSVALRIAIQESSSLPDPPWIVGVSYRPFAKKELNDPQSKTLTEWKKELVFNDRDKSFAAREPGTYEITSIEGKYCRGNVLVPSTCIVAEQPMPTIDLNFTSITDQCSGEIGLQANFLLTGKPPFRLHYLVSQVGRSPQKKTKIIQHSRDELVIQPDSPGQFSYSFVAIDDQFYQDVKILDKTIQQTVHPLAQARFVKGGRDENIWSCSGDLVQAEIELKGAPPYKVIYQILGEAPRLIEGISSSRATLDVAIPKKYIQKGGSFTLSMISITDGNGCLRNLTVPDLNIEVHRTKPTLKFYQSEAERKIVAREGESVSLPMRLTGNGPWAIEYTHNDSDEILEQTVYGPNDDLIVKEDGIYTLKAVRDRHCPGSVSDSTFVVEWLLRPSLMVSPNNQGELLGGVWVKPPVCELTEDTIEVKLEGTPPFAVGYSTLYRPSKKGEKPTRETRKLQILKTTGSIPLQTAEPGKYKYLITDLSDRIYNQIGPAGLLNSHRTGDIQIEQEVFSLPHGVMRTLPKTTYCVDETLNDSQRDKGVRIELTGQAPFDVQIEIMNQVTQISEVFDLHFKTSSSIISVPYRFRSAVSHAVSIKTIKDANSCVSAPSRTPTDLNSAIIQVAEIASIKPVSSKPYYCVGDSLDFLLKGSPPWLIKYEFNKKKSSITITSRDQARFSRLARDPGIFKITGIAHKEDLCTSKVEFETEIKPLPTVKISSGRNYIEDIREGDQSEIIFTFQGAPPFSFTYTRSLPEDRGNEKKILETHTVTDIQEKTYSIFAREEGTWSVTYIQDAYCAFPSSSLT